MVDDFGALLQVGVRPDELEALNKVAEAAAALMEFSMQNRNGSHYDARDRLRDALVTLNAIKGN